MKSMVCKDCQHHIIDEHYVLVSQEKKKPDVLICRKCGNTCHVQLLFEA